MSRAPVHPSIFCIFLRKSSFSRCHRPPQSPYLDEKVQFPKFPSLISSSDRHVCISFREFAVTTIFLRYRRYSNPDFFWDWVVFCLHLQAKRQATRCARRAQNYIPSKESSSYDICLTCGEVFMYCHVCQTLLEEGLLEVFEEGRCSTASGFCYANRVTSSLGCMIT